MLNIVSGDSWTWKQPWLTACRPSPLILVRSQPSSSASLPGLSHSNDLNFLQFTSSLTGVPHIGCYTLYGDSLPSCSNPSLTTPPLSRHSPLWVDLGCPPCQSENPSLEISPLSTSLNRGAPASQPGSSTSLPPIPLFCCAPGNCLPVCCQPCHLLSSSHPPAKQGKEAREESIRYKYGEKEGEGGVGGGG